MTDQIVTGIAFVAFFLVVIAMISITAGVSISNIERMAKKHNQLLEQICENTRNKSIPIKPVVDRYPWATCPVCGARVCIQNVQEHIYNGKKTYCEHCGQVFDWSDTE